MKEAEGRCRWGTQAAGEGIEEPGDEFGGDAAALVDDVEGPGLFSFARCPNDHFAVVAVLHGISEQVLKNQREKALVGVDDGVVGDLDPDRDAFFGFAAILHCAATFSATVLSEIAA